MDKTDSDSEKIGEDVEIMGLYVVVSGNNENKLVSNLIASAAQNGIFIVLFKMNFEKQTGIYLGNRKVLLQNKTIIQL